LLHNIIISVVFDHYNKFVDIADSTPLEFWLMTTACGLIVITVSAIGYRFVEHPFLVRKTESSVRSS
jgi:hypothetical protein